MLHDNALFFSKVTGRKGGAHSGSSCQAEDKDITKGKTGWKETRQLFPHIPVVM